MKLSVVVPAFRQTDLTVVHVRECMNSTRVPDEIVVVNDNGDTELHEKLKNLPRKCRLVYAYIREDVGFGYNHACNLGVWLASGEVFTIEDADHIPLRDTYANALSLFENDKTLGRVSFKRQWVSLSDVLSKPFKEWSPYGGLGANAMVAMYKRDVYTKVCGQDERMNEYGWLAYNWKASERKINTVVKVIGGFYIIKDGSEQNIVRNMSLKNRRIFKEDANNPHYNNVHGILNFSYDVDFMEQS